jgi:hypothetical protein
MRGRRAGISVITVSSRDVFRLVATAHRASELDARADAELRVERSDLIGDCTRRDVTARGDRARRKAEGREGGDLLVRPATSNFSGERARSRASATLAGPARKR